MAVALYVFDSLLSAVVPLIENVTAKNPSNNRTEYAGHLVGRAAAAAAKPHFAPTSSVSISCLTLVLSIRERFRRSGLYASDISSLYVNLLCDEVQRRKSLTADESWVESGGDAFHPVRSAMSRELAELTTVQMFPDRRMPRSLKSND